ncbi:MAG: hypothetical protein KAJ29_00440 [Alphaproteobacteria bacterium]|nr:hypothetical protein [Alphaproteobacteria bacterium]
MIASFIVLLYLSGIISSSSAITSLYMAGILLILAEIGVVSFGLIALNGLIALYAAYTIQSGSDMIFGLSIGWPIFFGIVMVEISIILTIIAVHMRLRKQKHASGTESMIGDKATVIEWSGCTGRVRYQGEIWKARSEQDLIVEPDQQVTIKTVNKLDLIVNNSTE